LVQLKEKRMKKSDLIMEWNRAKQIQKLTMLSLTLLALVACLIARLAYLATN
jgi:hypothetical protein